VVTGQGGAKWPAGWSSWPPGAGTSARTAASAEVFWAKLHTTVLSHHFLRRAALLAWECPQNALGAALFAAQAARRNIVCTRFDRERVMVEIRSFGAISLGLFVFFTNQDNPYVPVGRENLDHEYGHSIQSRWLGPLYLPIVGVTSELRVLYAFAHRHLRGYRWAGYYHGFPESWADRLGCVDRSLRPPP
jgi:hypothetical protein